MAAAQTEPAAARSAERAALERHAFCRLLGEGDTLRGLDVLLDSEAAAGQRLDGTDSKMRRSSTRW